MAQEIFLITKEDLENVLKEIIHREFTLYSETLLATKENKSDEELITKKEVLRLLKISAPTLDKRIKEGRIPVNRLGRRLLFSKQNILRELPKGK